jgi:hypothetical protein
MGKNCFGCWGREAWPSYLLIIQRASIAKNDVYFSDTRHRVTLIWPKYYPQWHFFEKFVFPFNSPKCWLQVSNIYFSHCNIHWRKIKSTIPSIFLSFIRHRVSPDISDTILKWLRKSTQILYHWREYSETHLFTKELNFYDLTAEKHCRHCGQNVIAIRSDE